MVPLSTWLRYMSQKLEYSVTVSWTKYTQCLIAKKEVTDTVWKHFQEKLTYLHWYKGDEMAPTIAGQGGTLLVRKIPLEDPILLFAGATGSKYGTLGRQVVGARFINNFYLSWTFISSHDLGCKKQKPGCEIRRVFVEDVVVFKDPKRLGNYLVRRLAAVGGDEMLSTDKDDEPFVLRKYQGWVLSDNKNLKPKEAEDSRDFGPIDLPNIVGRVIYRLSSAVDHGPVKNSRFSMRRDAPVLKVELDVDDMAKNHKAAVDKE